MVQFAENLEPLDTTDSGHKVDDAKKFKFSTRDNSLSKWQNQHSRNKEEERLCTGPVLGALEVVCDPYLDVEAPFTFLDGKFAHLDDIWQRCQEGWENDHKKINGVDSKDHHHESSLSHSFRKACQGVPVTTSCCGLVNNDDERIHALVPYLNKHWAPKANKRLEKYGASVHAFLWHWQNVQGKSDTFILLLRFCELSSPS